jgi:hypothetical protein
MKRGRDGNIGRSGIWAKWQLGEMKKRRNGKWARGEGAIWERAKWPGREKWGQNGKGRNVKGRNRHKPYHPLVNKKQIYFFHTEYIDMPNEVVALFLLQTKK